MFRTPPFYVKSSQRAAWPLKLTVACRTSLFSISFRSFKTKALFDDKLAKATGNVDTTSFKLGKLSHVAIATANIDKSISFYRDVLKASIGEKHV